MSDHVEALEALLAKVEAGEFDPEPGGAHNPKFNAFMDLAEQVFPKNVHGCNALAWTAYNRNSLDAAKALHDAVLPDAKYQLTFEDNSFDMAISHKGMIYGVCITANPARAWLAAILKALIATDKEGA